MSTNCLLDVSFFPHIIDAIWAHAGLSSLLGLRVCKAWREKADRLIAYHLVIEGNTPPFEIRSGLPGGGRLMHVTAATLDIAKGLRPSWANFVRVIDLDATRSLKEVCELLTAWNVDSHETIRFIDGAPVWDEHAMLPEQPLRIIHFQPTCLNSPQHFAEVKGKNPQYKTTDWRVLPEASSATHHRNFLGVACDKTVLHQTEADRTGGLNDELAEEMADLTGLPFLVVVLHPWAEPAYDQDEVEGDFYQGFWRNLGETSQIIYRCLTWSGPEGHVVIVGLEKMGAECFGLCDAELEGMSLEEALRQTLHEEWQHRPWPEEGEEFKLSFKTLEEYRKEAGPADFEIEMSSAITNLRHTWSSSDANKYPPPWERMGYSSQ